MKTWRRLRSPLTPAAIATAAWLGCAVFVGDRVAVTVIQAAKTERHFCRFGSECFGANAVAKKCCRDVAEDESARYKTLLYTCRPICGTG